MFYYRNKKHDFYKNDFRLAIQSLLTYKNHRA